MLRGYRGKARQALQNDFRIANVGVDVINNLPRNGSDAFAISHICTFVRTFAPLHLSPSEFSPNVRKNEKHRARPSRARCAKLQNLKNKKEHRSFFTCHFTLPFRTFAPLFAPLHRCTCPQASFPHRGTQFGPWQSIGESSEFARQPRKSKYQILIWL